VTERAAEGRFTVMISAGAIRAAKAAGVSLPPLVGRALDHVNALLPGPPTTITIKQVGASELIPQTGTNRFTNPYTGLITIGFGPTSQTSAARTLRFWLRRTLSHEVDHSVRRIGPGFGFSLLQQTISEGISSVFDVTAFPGPQNPWDRAISRSQECTPLEASRATAGGQRALRPVDVRRRRRTALDGVHDRLRHRQRLPAPPRAHNLGRVDRCQREHDPRGQPLSTLLSLRRWSAPSRDAEPILLTRVLTAAVIFACTNDFSDVADGPVKAEARACRAFVSVPGRCWLPSLPSRLPSPRPAEQVARLERSPSCAPRHDDLPRMSAASARDALRHVLRCV
jgi:hypothetical protein